VSVHAVQQGGQAAAAVLAAVLAAPVAASVRGEVETESHWLTLGGPDDGTVDYQSVSGDVRWRGGLTDGIEGRLHIHGRLGNEDSAFDALRLDAAWAEATNGPWDFRVGQQRIVWGVMESSRLTDALNASDFQADLIEPRAIGSPSMRLRYWQGASTLELYWQPVTATNVYPGPESPNFVGGGKTGLDYRPDDRLGARLLFEGRYAYLAATWLRGPEIDTYTFPQVIFADEQPVNSERFGLAAQWFADDLVLRAEAVHRRLLDDVDPVAKRGAGPPAQDETLYSVGAEYNLRGLVGRGDVTMFVEYFRSSERERAGALTNDLFVGAEIRFNDLRSQTLEVFAQDTFADDKADRFFRLRYVRLITERVELRAEYTRARGIYAGTPGSDTREVLGLGLTVGF